MQDVSLHGLIVRMLASIPQIARMLGSNFNNLPTRCVMCHLNRILLNEQQHELSNNVVCAVSKGSDQPAHMRSLIRAFANRLTIP